MKILLFLVAAVLLAVLSVKFVARAVGARSETAWILLCFLLHSAVGELLRRFDLHWLPGLVISFAAGSVVYAAVLSTTFKNGVVISLVSTGLMTIGVLVLAAFAIGTADRSTDGTVTEQATRHEMEARHSESLARDRNYQVIAERTYFGDGKAVRMCIGSPGSPPEAIVVYFEILPGGTLGKTRYEPLNDLSQCLREKTAGRRFPPPPGAYVARAAMKFQKG